MSTQAKRLRKVLHQIVEITKYSQDDDAQSVFRIATETLTGQVKEDVSELTELERARDAVVEAAIEHDGALQMVPIANQDGDRETRYAARDYVKETRRALRSAVNDFQAVRAAQGRTG